MNSQIKTTHSYVKEVTQINSCLFPNSVHLYTVGMAILMIWNCVWCFTLPLSIIFLYIYPPYKKP